MTHMKFLRFILLTAVLTGYPAGEDQPKDKWKRENIHYDHW